MRIGITYRLFLAILLATAFAVASMVIIMQRSLDRGFLRYVNAIEKTGHIRLAAKLEESYAVERNWDFLRGSQARWRSLVIESLPGEDPGQPHEVPPGGFPGNVAGLDRPLPQGEPPFRSPDVQPPFPSGDAPPMLPGKPPSPRLVGSFAHRLFLLDSNKRAIISRTEIPAGSETKPLHFQGRVVGYLGLLPHGEISDERQLRFLKQQKNAFVLVAGVLVLLAAGLSLILAKRLIRPIRALAGATHDLASGRYNTRVPETSSDELGQLARDFNVLALTLEKNEQTRRQWVADISHELRTPLAVLRGEIEAIQDGIRQPTADSIRSLHGEVMRLNRLVDDLYQLSLSDLGALTCRKEELDLAELLTDVLAMYRDEFSDKGIRITDDIPLKPEPLVFGDPGRLHQLFANLLDNALKYTDSGGELAILLECRECQATIDFLDSSPGVPVNDLEKLFDRLFRVESSRSRKTGGAGLGLAICRNIVEAHSGNIVARHSPTGGLWIRITLPQAGGA
jgi:two-component system sensor histidine kinase BaeS